MNSLVCFYINVMYSILFCFTLKIIYLSVVNQDVHLPRVTRYVPSSCAYQCIVRVKRHTPIVT